LLTNKLYSDNRGPSYTYTPDGKLLTRTWARGVVTTYGYSRLGELTNISYSDNTPAVTFTFDRLGRQTTITDSQGTRTFTYNDALQLAAETNVTGQLTRNFDSLGRSSGFQVGADLGSAPYSVSNSFDSLGRFSALSSVVGGISNSWNYFFLPDSELLSGWTAMGSGVTVTRNYEPNRNLLTGISNGAGSTLISGFDYVNDAAGRRTLRIDEGSAVATNVFGYNSRSELTTALMGTNSFAWELDPIGNRVSATGNSVTHNYTANALNQYTQITNGGLRTLNYDLDGNLTNDGVFAYSWDGENRMVGAANGSTVAHYCYDYMSRRHQKIVNGVTNNFVYDGWNLVSEISNDGAQSITNHYVWGLDLSGTLQGAGGIGGLLSVTRNGMTYFPCYDANGNITDYADINGVVVAHREYDAYGNTLVASGSMVDDFSFWFSSKYLDRETGLYYYGYRQYSPELGRWLSRDPLTEYGARFLSRQILRASRVDLFAGRAYFRALLASARERGAWDDIIYASENLAKISRVLAESERGRYSTLTYVALRNAALNYLDKDGRDAELTSGNTQSDIKPIPKCPKTEGGLKGLADFKAGWCLDTSHPHKDKDGNPLVPPHGGCYRTYSDQYGGAGAQCCYNEDGNLAEGETGESPDTTSPVSGIDKNGKCEFSLCSKNYWKHVRDDWWPAVKPKWIPF